MEHVSKTFYSSNGYFTAVEDVSFSLKDGEFLVLLGPGRCGKTVLLNMIAGIETRSGGTILYNGKEKDGADEDFGMVFQSLALMPFKTVMENVELPLVYRGVRPAERARRVAAALERVGLSNRAKHLPTELSGGQQQRVAIARALVTEPSLLLADEPTGNLDSKTSREIMDILHELHEQGNTVVLITHDNDIARQAKRSIHILDGRVTEVQL